MTSAALHLDDGPQKLSNSTNPAKQELLGSDRTPSPQRLGIAAVAAVTPDSADRASGGSRARTMSLSSESSIGSSRLHELRSQRNAKLGALKERIRKTSHNTLTTPDTALAKQRHRNESGEQSNSEVNSIHSGNSANSRNSDYRPTPRIEQLRARRQQRLDEYRSRSPSAEDTPPQVITLNGADVQALAAPLLKASDRKGIHSSDGAVLGKQNLSRGVEEVDQIGNLASVENYKANTALSKHHDASNTPTEPSPLRQDGVPSFDRRIPGRKRALKRRSSAPNVYKGISDEMLNDDMLSGLSKLDRLRLRRAQIHEKAKMANAAVSRLTEEVLSQHIYDDAFTMPDEIAQPSPAMTRDRGASGALGEPQHRRRRSSAPNVYKGITEQMLDDEMLSGLSKLDRLRLRRAQTQEKAQMANAAVSRLKEAALHEELAKQLRDARKEHTKLQRELEVSKAALQRAREEKLAGAKTAAEAENDTFGLCNMIDELQGEVDMLEDSKIEDDIRVEEALHNAKLEVAQLKEQLEETQSSLSQLRRENQELNHQNQLQQVRHSDVTKMWEHRVDGLVSQLRDLQYSLQDLSQARLQERSDLLRHVVLLQKENQRLRIGGTARGKANGIIGYSKPGIATAFGASLTFMPFGSLLGGRHRTSKATGDIWDPMNSANQSKVKSQRGVSTFLKRCTGLMTWDTVKNVAFGAGIMGLVLMSGDPQMTNDAAGPYVRLEISKPRFN